MEQWPAGQRTDILAIVAGQLAVDQHVDHAGGRRVPVYIIRLGRNPRATTTRFYPRRLRYTRRRSDIQHVNPILGPRIQSKRQCTR